MVTTVEDLADELGVDAGDVRVLVEMYGPDEVEVWEEEGVLSPLTSYDLSLVLSPVGERHIPEYFLRQAGWRNAPEWQRWAKGTC